MKNYFDADAVAAAKKHAIKCYPEESCGAIIDKTYYPLANVALAPDQHEEGNESCGCRLCSFKFDTKELLQAADGRDIQIIIHSHPDGPMFPSRADMECQIETDVPWGILATDGARTTDLIMWGDSLPIAPLLGRHFLHGIHDCYSLVRDTFRMGREKCAEQGIDWPLEPILLPEVPRDDAWWAKGENLYIDHFLKAGFRKISMDEARPGDGFLMILSPPARHNEPPPPKVINHAGLLLSNDLILHHMPGETRVSRREPVSGWARMAELWLRYEGPGHDA